MALEPGYRVGSYEILERLSVGGMSEIYRARDLELGREVAVKALPEHWGEDPERVARFEREAQLLAALRHPNIAVIHGLERDRSRSFLILELIPGETLAERIARGPLSFEEARRLFVPIALALEAAHEKGIVHRDLKPSNVMIQTDGTVKLLDFGLGKDIRPRVDPSQRTETYLGPESAEGIAAGTPAYMSPEQVRRRPVGKATDIWSFGVTLFEALSGRAPFTRDTLADTLSAILNAEPRWAALPREVPRRIQILLARCLRKEERRRLRDIADARMELEEAPAAERAGSALFGVGLGLALGIGLAALGWIFLAAPGRESARGAVGKFAIELPPTAPVSLENGSAIAVSPDGSRIAYATGSGDRKAIHIRRLGGLDALAVPGTNGGESPFFSPDGEWLGFFGSGEMKKLSLAAFRGEAPIRLAAAEAPRGSAWISTDEILFAASPSEGLALVSSRGGAPKPIEIEPSSARDHRWPAALPGGRHALFTLWTDHGFAIAALDVRSGTVEKIVENGSYPRYAPTGHLIFARDGNLFAAAFDPDRRRLLSIPELVLENVGYDPRTGAAFYDFSRRGDLFYVRAVSSFEGERTRAFLVDERGRARPIGAPRPGLQVPRFSPDGKTLLTTSMAGATTDVWALDLERSVETRLTSGGNNAAAVFSPDGRRIAFASDREGVFAIYSAPADGSAKPRRLSDGSYPEYPTSFSPDGRLLACTVLHPETGLDVHVLTVESGDRHVFLASEYEEAGAVFSPDGLYLAYTSNESGREEVYVRRYPGPEGRFRVSKELGSEPMWSRDGGTLYFRSGDQMLAASMRAGPELELEAPRVLFEAPFDTAGALHANYDVGPEPGTFVMIRSEKEGSASSIQVVLNWFAELRERVPHP